MIVKVQSPLGSSDPDPKYLVYDEDRTFQLYVSFGDHPDLDEAMRDCTKRFFMADLGTEIPGHLNIDTEKHCPEQDW